MASNPFVLDFSPINNVLAQWQKRQQFDAQQDLAREDMAQKDKQWGASNALAQAQLGLQKRTADRADALHPLDKRYKQAQIDLLLARMRALKNAQQAKATPVEMPQPELAMRPDGSIYEISNGSVGSGIMPVGSAGAISVHDNFMPVAGGDGGGFMTAGGAGTKEKLRPYHMAYGANATTNEIPGIVTTPEGVPSEFATRVYQGQRAIDKMPDADRRRFIEWKEVQDRWTAFYGSKPKPGMMYDRTGRLVPIGPLSKSADEAERKDRAIDMVLKDIDAAEKTFKSGWFPGVKRTIAPALKDLGVPGRTINNILSLEEEAEAYNAIKMGVLQTVYALSGKQTTNKEMEAFLSNYMPQGGESEFMLESKLKRLRKFLSTLRSKVKRGMVYDEAERNAIRDSEPPQARNLKNKYGLE
jgi:hypothetical protein